jgi:hypothetical protein
MPQDDGVVVAGRVPEQPLQIARAPEPVEAGAPDAT